MSTLETLIYAPEVNDEWRDWFKKDIRIKGKLVSVALTLYAGDHFGSAARTIYSFEPIEDWNLGRLILPDVTGIAESWVKSGDRIEICTRDQVLVVEIRSPFLRRLKHQYTASYQELERKMFK